MNREICHLFGVLCFDSFFFSASLVFVTIVVPLPVYTVEELSRVLYPLAFGEFGNIAHRIN